MLVFCFRRRRLEPNDDDLLNPGWTPAQVEKMAIIQLSMFIPRGTEAMMEFNQSSMFIRAGGTESMDGQVEGRKILE